MIQIYIQELFTYNNAVPVGKWMNVEDFETEILKLFEEATVVLKDNNFHYGLDAEEYEIVDWECEIDINLNSIYQDIDKLKELNELLTELNKEELDKLRFLFDMNGMDVKDIDNDTFDNVYTYNDWDEAIEEFIEYFLEVPDDSKIYGYINYSAVQRDLEIDGYTEYENRIYKSLI